MYCLSVTWAGCDFVVLRSRAFPVTDGTRYTLPATPSGTHGLLSVFGGLLGGVQGQLPLLLREGLRSSVTGGENRPAFSWTAAFSIRVLPGCGVRAVAASISLRFPVTLEIFARPVRPSGGRLS